jgi:DNA-binding SARP family transcriptional activator
MFHGVRFELLGPVRGWRDGAELELGAPQQRALLVVLLLARGRQVGLDTILDALWEEHIPKAAVGTARTYISRLRNQLETPTADEPDVRIRSVGDGYVLVPGTFELDVDVFQKRLAEARAARANQEAAKAAQLMRDALELWHGTALSGMPGPFADSRRLHLNDLYMAATEEKLALDVMTGEHAAVIPEYRALLRKHPFHEGLAELLMLALYKSSRQAEALMVFDDMRRRLRDELGLYPGPALQDMHQRILRSDSELFSPAKASSGHLAWAQVVRFPASHRERKVQVVPRHANSFRPLISRTTRSGTPNPSCHIPILLSTAGARAVRAGSGERIGVLEHPGHVVDRTGQDRISDAPAHNLASAASAPSAVPRWPAGRRRHAPARRGWPPPPR